MPGQNPAYVSTSQHLKHGKTATNAHMYTRKSVKTKSQILVPTEGAANHFRPQANTSAKLTPPCSVFSDIMSGSTLPEIRNKI